MSGLTGVMAEYFSDLSWDDIPASVQNKARMLVIDTVGCMFGGSGAEGIAEILQYVSKFDSSRDAGVFGHPARLSIQNAAYANAVSAHARDYDDTHDEAVNHASVTALPPLIAMSQYLSNRSLDRDGAVRLVSGKEFLTAFCIALEVTNRVSLAFIPYLAVGWLPTTLSGPFGSACGVAKLIGSSADSMRSAMGFAYTQIHGNRQALIEGTLAKRIQPAFSAVAGIHSAFLGDAGLSGPEEVFTGDYGIAALYTNGKIKADRLTANLGSEWEIERISIKPYPSCRCTHPVIDAVLHLREKHNINFRDIAEGMILLPPASMGQIGQEFTIGTNPTVNAQFSAQYTAALGFVKGKPGIADFDNSAITGSLDIIELAKRFRVEEFEKMNRGLSPVELSVKTKGGSRFYTRMETITGSVEKPMSKELLREKFHENLRFAEVRNSAITAAWDRLENLEHAEDIGILFDTIQNECK